jgi:hypothetical protein
MCCQRARCSRRVQLNAHTCRDDAFVDLFDEGCSTSLVERASHELLTDFKPVGNDG